MRSSSPGVLDALFGDLDDRTRRRFGLETDGPPAADRPRPHPAGPEVGLRDMGKDDWLTVGKSVYTQIGADRVTSVAGGITFFGLLSLFPALTALVSIYGLVADPATIAGHLDMLRSFLPASALDIIREQVASITASPETALSVAGIFGLLIAFYSANGGMKAMLSALNVAFYQSETRSFLRLNLMSAAFTLAGLVMIIGMLGVVAVLPIALKLLPVPGSTEMWVSLIRWPILFALLILALAGLYRWGPAAPKSRWRWVSPGAAVAAVGLVVISILFSWYAANFADYNETYGSLGAVVALMTWLWLASTVVLIGAEINSELEAHLKRLAGVPDERETDMA